MYTASHNTGIMFIAELQQNKKTRTALPVPVKVTN